jgi:DmsE family decaheme c-type cytochrome
MKRLAAITLMSLLLSTSSYADPAERIELTPIEGDAKACLECHDGGKVNPILGTAHFVEADPRSPAANRACEACHGPSKEHSLYPQKISSLRFGSDSKSSFEDQSKPCLTCHQSDHVNWGSSTHAMEDMSCASCHTVHAHKDKALSPLTENDVCLTCHLQEKMEINKPYRHPIREGAVSCSNCHDPHGSNGPSMLVKQSVNETCYSCHAEKRGPFVNEHEPVQDNCMNCHTPHGSNHENLLLARSPFICAQCHSDHSHSREAYDFEELPGGTGTRQNRVVGGSCLNCHSQIHGSNKPGARSMRE